MARVRDVSIDSDLPLTWSAGLCGPLWVPASVLDRASQWEEACQEAWEEGCHLRHTEEETPGLLYNLLARCNSSRYHS